MKGGKSFIRVLSTVVMLLCAMCFVACGQGNKNDNKRPPKTETKILSPYVVSLGDYISWDAAKNADKYDIYKNGVYLETTTQTEYFIGDTSADEEYYVIAKNENIESEKSNIAYVSKNQGYDSGEILDLTGKMQYSGTVKSEIRKIIIGKDVSSAFHLSIEIEERSTDLIFRLNNVAITGSINTANRSYSRKTNNYSVIFEISGECSIRGENGLDGTDWSDKRYDNKELDAGEGYSGKDAVIVPSMIVRGNGNLSVVGGNGGNGGIGSSTTDFEKVNCPGVGSNGGNGGAAVKTSHMILRMDSGNCSVSLLDGKGGLKGNPGKNGSIYTGPTVSLMWNDMFDIGKAGKDAKSVIVVKKIATGKLVF